MTDDTIPPFSFPAIHAKKVTAAFDGGRLTSNGGVMLLAMAERRLGLANNLARVFPDRRDPTRVVHSLVDMFRARMFAICCGYEDADDLDHLRSDPAFKLACGRLPDTGRDLCSQPTLSRLENSPRLRDVIRLTYTLVDAWMDSYPCEPASVTLDIDDTCDVVHGHQQLSLFNAHYDERCFLPIHIYDTEKSRPVAVVLRPGKTPGGVEVRAHLRRLIRHIRTRWQKTRITFRGDGHYARPEAMTWCENHGIDYIFGLSGNVVLDRLVEAAGVCIDIGAIDLPVSGEPGQQPVEQVHVGAGRERQVQVGDFGGRRAPRIERDDLRAPLLAGREHALQDDRVTPCGVRTHQHDQVGRLEIVVTHGHDIFAERPLVPGHGRGHAQA